MTHIPFDTLSAEHRIRVLQWMKHGIDSGLKMMCEGRAHQALVRSLHGGPAFDPVSVWDSYGESSQEHFDHSQTAIDQIDALIAAAENEIATRSAPAPPLFTRSEPIEKTEEPTVITKKRPAKKKR